MAFSRQEKDRIRYHAGYLSVSAAASLQFGQPVPQQTLFLIESAMTRVLPEAEDRVRRTVNVLDGIECKLIQAQDRLAATSLGELHLREKEPDLLEDEYYRWASRLVDILGVPLYPYSNRFRRRVTAGNVSVSG